jgi:hypothetical protein
MLFITPTLEALSNEESAANNGANWRAIVTADMLTEPATNTAQTVTLMDLIAGDYMLAVWWKLKRAFEDVSDAAFNNNTMSVGDTATGVAAHIAAKQVNVNGTEIESFASFTPVGPYAATDKVSATFNSMAAKALLSLDRGEVHYYIKHLRPSVLTVAQSGIGIATK